MLMPPSRTALRVNVEIGRGAGARPDSQCARSCSSQGAHGGSRLYVRVAYSYVEMTTPNHPRDEKAAGKKLRDTYKRERVIR